MGRVLTEGIEADTTSNFFPNISYRSTARRASAPQSQVLRWTSGSGFSNLEPEALNSEYAANSSTTIRACTSTRGNGTTRTKRPRNARVGAGGDAFGVGLDSEEKGGREDGSARSWRARGKTVYVVLYIFCLLRCDVRGRGGRHFGRWNLGGSDLGEGSIPWSKNGKSTW